MKDNFLLATSFSCSLFEQSQNIGPFQLLATLRQGAPSEVTGTRLPNPLTKDTCHRRIFKELHSTVQESVTRVVESQNKLGAVLPDK